MRLPDWKNAKVRRNATFSWVILSLLWSITRAAIIWRVFGKHGTNGFGYLFVDLATTVPYAIYSARAAFAWIDRSPSFWRHLMIASLCFIAPDLFVVVTARNVPVLIWFGFAGFVSIMAILAIKFARKDKA
jgi:hypothetical protein